MGARPLVRDAGERLWVQLLEDLRRRLAEGEFAAAFPGELALVEQYGVSRHTVRQALRSLRSEGAVSAERGRSPRVMPPAGIEQQLGTLYSLFDSVEATGVAQRSIVHTLGTRADGVIATRLGLEESTPLVYLERLRLAGTEPLAVDRVWLPASLATPLLDVDFGRTALYDEYARLCGVHLTGGQEQIRAVVPTPTERNLLGIGEGVAALVIERLGCAHGFPVEWRQTLVRGDRFRVTANFPAGTGYRVGTDHRIDPTRPDPTSSGRTLPR
jgi:GntR family transcriptional regulator